jgi:REP element-mobilizing transposase RayT
MKYDPEIHHRRSIRLEEYDYSATGAYFVTACAQNRDCLFGEIANGIMVLNDAGLMVGKWWQEISTKFDNVMIDTHVVMPNHFHGIICIVGATLRGRPDFAESVGAPLRGCPAFDLRAEEPGRPHRAAPTLGDVMNWFKTMTTNAYIRGVKQSDWSPFPGRLWQRNYYERVVRDDEELTAIREYILCNPMQWAEDKENPTTRLTICRGTPMWVPD